MAKSGDHVQIKSGQILINGEMVAELDQDVLDKVKRSASDYDMDTVLEENALWVMGTSKDSYDSRYWGPITNGQVTGQVYPLF